MAVTCRDMIWVKPGKSGLLCPSAVLGSLGIAPHCGAVWGPGGELGVPGQLGAMGAVRGTKGFMGGV